MKVTTEHCTLHEIAISRESYIRLVRANMPKHEDLVNHMALCDPVDAQRLFMHLEDKTPEELEIEAYVGQFDDHDYDFIKIVMDRWS